MRYLKYERVKAGRSMVVHSYKCSVMPDVLINDSFINVMYIVNDVLSKLIKNNATGSRIMAS